MLKSFQELHAIYAKREKCALEYSIANDRLFKKQIKFKENEDSIIKIIEDGLASNPWFYNAFVDPAVKYLQESDYGFFVKEASFETIMYKYLGINLN